MKNLFRVLAFLIISSMTSCGLVVNEEDMKPSNDPQMESIRSKDDVGRGN